MITIYDKATKVVIGRQDAFEETEAYGVTESVCTAVFIKSCYEVSTNTFFEGATSDEINAYNKSLVPEYVSIRQLKIQLLLNGVDLSLIDNAIEALPIPQRYIARVAWNNAQNFYRADPLLNSLAPVISYSDTDVDNLFINAKIL